MTEVKMPEPEYMGCDSVGDIFAYTEDQLKQYGDDRVREALAQPAHVLVAITRDDTEQGWQPTNAAMDALRRFEETCADNEGYDVPKDTMRNLQAIGLIYRTYGDMYCITDFGNHMLASAPKGGV